MHSTPNVTVKCDNQEIIGKEKWHRTRLEKPKKDNKVELWKKILTK